MKNIDEEELLVLGPGGNCKHIAVATIRLTWNPQLLAYDKKITGELIDLAQFEPDREFMQAFADDFKRIKEFVDTPVGILTSDISTRDAMFGPSEFVDFIHRVQLDITNADVSFVAPLSFDATVSAGQLYVRDMFSLYRFENYLYTLELSGYEIKNYLEYSYGNWMNRMKNQEDLMLLYRHDEKGAILKGRNGRPMLRGPSYNFDAAAGIRYTVDISRPSGERIKIHSLQNGSTFKLNDTYKVAVNSYRGSGGGGHLENGAGISREDFSKRLLASTPKDFRYYLMDWIKEQGTVTPVAFDNWKVIPEEWWTKAREKEMKLLFNGQ